MICFLLLLLFFNDGFALTINFDDLANQKFSGAEYKPSPDFDRAVGSMSALTDAAKQFDSSHVFNGERLSCRKDGFAYNDCCRDTGWGHNLHLAGCSESEIKMGVAIERGMCHKLGSYCEHSILGQCIRHKQSACCFSSTLARLVQEQGRKELGISWGSKKHPNCRGFTVEELQRIDLGRIEYGIPKEAFTAAVIDNEQWLSPDLL